MKLLRLKMVRGHRCGTEIVIEPGQTVVIGRSSSAQFSLPEDVLISSLHAQLEFSSDGEGQVSDLGSMNGTFVNGGRVSSTGILDGDTLRLGKTEWTVMMGDGVSGNVYAMEQPASFHPEPSRTAPDIPVVPPPRQVSDDFPRVIPLMEDVISQYPSVEALAGMREQITGGTKTMDWLKQLVSEKRIQEALAVLANALVNPAGVWWVCQVVRGLDPGLTESDQKRLRLAEQWVTGREERCRREAFAAAESDRMASASSWACVAAFWSGDNIAPADAPAAVRPVADLPGKAITAAIQLCVARVPEETSTRNTKAVELGLTVARGDLTWHA